MMIYYTDPWGTISINLIEILTLAKFSFGEEFIEVRTITYNHNKDIMTINSICRLYI